MKPGYKPKQWTAPSDVAISHEIGAKLDAALAELPDEQREVIVLRLQGDLPFREIARLNEISINTALSRYRYGLEKLRSTFDGELTP